jgi:hypothetical protein
MPTRLLREGILDSDRINLLDWPAEVFYRRLMSKVDDHGLYDARPSMLRATLYPVGTDRVREADISRWLAACEKAGLILLYEAGGKRFLKMLDTRWQARSEPKYPLPHESGCKQMETTVHLDAVEGVVEGETPRKRGYREVPEGWTPKDTTVESVGREFGLRVPEDVDRYVAAFHDICRAKGYRYKDFDAAFRNCVRQDWPKLRNGNAAPVGKRKVAL